MEQSISISITTPSITTPLENKNAWITQESKPMNSPTFSSSTHSLRDPSVPITFNSQDVLVLFGELYPGGYAQGLVAQAQKHGMTIITSTVGRRDENDELRPLTPEELASFSQPCINVPLEAGFDKEGLERNPPPQGPRIVDALRGVKLSDWESFSFTESDLHQARTQGKKRWEGFAKKHLEELEKILLQQFSNSKTGLPRRVIFAHLMAGGVPRAKVVLPLMNRSLRGTGERFLSSEKFWNSGIGQFCAQNFEAVTADTFDGLLRLSSSLRNRIIQSGGSVSYLAFGYHGTEILIGDHYEWQTYTPYLQGWAKRKLESYSQYWSEQGLSCCVYNCPEILTNSSAIFTGVELSLYPLILALQKELSSSSSMDTPLTSTTMSKLRTYLKPDFKEEVMKAKVLDYFHHPKTLAHSQFALWPQHNHQAQLEYMLQKAKEFSEFAVNPDDLLKHLSSLVIEAVGKVLLHDIEKPKHPVSWVNHDVLAKILIQNEYSERTSLK